MNYKPKLPIIHPNWPIIAALGRCLSRLVQSHPP
uniref:Cytochrome b n=1 Tax=Romanomermis culicivorax TaxID=13658 RepID=A0A915KNU7_ROMCU